MSKDKRNSKAFMWKLIFIVVIVAFAVLLVLFLTGLLGGKKSSEKREFLTTIQQTCDIYRSMTNLTNSCFELVYGNKVERIPEDILLDCGQIVEIWDYDNKKEKDQTMKLFDGLCNNTNLVIGLHNKCIQFVDNMTVKELDCKEIIDKYSDESTNQ